MEVKEKVQEKVQGILGDDGKLGMDNILSQMLKSENGGVDREAFLREVLEGKCSQEQIEQAISENPAAAGIDTAILASLADEAKTVMLDNIKEKPDLKGSVQDILNADKKLKEAASVIGSLQENKTLREALRIAQKNLYLFGFPEVKFNEDGTVCGNKGKLCMLLAFSVMAGVDEADDALKALAGVIYQLEDAEIGKEQLASEVLSEIIPDFRKKILGFKAAFTASNSNPLLGKLVSSVNMKVNQDKFCDRLRDALADTVLTDPKHEGSALEKEYAEKFAKMAQ